MAKIKNKQELISKIKNAEGFSNEEKSQMLALINENKSYGFVWEDTPEDKMESMRDLIPVLTEEKNKAITDTASECDGKPNHVIIESDNLHGLTSLYCVLDGQFDAIYIDPPYNSGARDWKYNNDYVDSNDVYKHSHWLSMMKNRLSVAKRLLKPEDSILIVTIDEKEYLHLGCLLETLFPNAKIQMVSSVINPAGVARENQFSRSDEYLFFVQIGKSSPQPMPLDDEWYIKADKQFKSLYWRSLSRAGSNDTRKHSPGCFYPIFVNTEGSKIHSVGEAIPLGTDRRSIKTPEGTVAIWPLHMDGSEGCWMQSPKNLRLLIKKGYVHLGNFTERGMSIKYLNKKEIEKVESGLFEIIGYREDGSIITDDNDAVRDVLPTTQWRISSHNARSGGTELLKSILGPNAFPYPKSLYAVHDCLMFYVKNKKDARILDFFAGSGTTMHATMLLNKEDGGNRQCILITNNENNICEEVTYERNKRVIEGYTKPNGEIVEGLKNNNLRYFKVGFTPREKTDENMFRLAKNSINLLRIKHDVYKEKQFGALENPYKRYRYFEEDGKQLLVILDTELIGDIVEQLEEMEVSKPIPTYVFATGAYPFTEDFESVADKVELYPLPHGIYQACERVMPKMIDKEIENPEGISLSDEELETSMDDLTKEEA